MRKTKLNFIHFYRQFKHLSSFFYRDESRIELSGIQNPVDRALYLSRRQAISASLIFLRSSEERGGRKGRTAAERISPIITRASLIRVCQLSLGWE